MFDTTTEINYIKYIFNYNNISEYYCLLYFSSNNCKLGEHKRLLSKQNLIIPHSIDGVYRTVMQCVNKETIKSE